MIDIVIVIVGFRSWHDSKTQVFHIEVDKALMTCMENLVMDALTETANILGCG